MKLIRNNAMEKKSKKKKNAKSAMINIRQLPAYCRRKLFHRVNMVNIHRPSF